RGCSNANGILERIRGGANALPPACQARKIAAMFKSIEWTGHSVRLLDQTKLPGQTDYVDISDEKQMHEAIRRLVVRGAPAIGVAAAFGAYLGVRDATDDS